MKSRHIFALLASAAALVASGPATAQIMKPATDWVGKPIPLETFGQFELLDSPRISPDGKWIAAKVRAGKRQALAILAVGQANVPVTMVAHDEEAMSDSVGEKQVLSWRWLDGDNLLIEFDSRDNLGGQWFDNVRYAAYNRVTKKTTPLGWENSFAGTDLLWASNSGAPRIVLSRVNPSYGTELLGHPEVIEVDVLTGKTKTLVRPNPIVSSWQTDMDGVVRFGSSFDGDTGKIRVVYRPDASADFKTLVATTETGITTDLQIPTIILRGNKAYSINSKSGYAALYEYDLATMKMGKQVFAVDGYDIGNVDLTPDRTTIEGVTYETDRSRETFFTPRMKDVLSALEDSFGKGNVSIESTDEKESKIVFATGATGQMPAYFVFDTVTGGIGRIAWGNDLLKNSMLNPVTTVRYQTTDGKTVEAVLTMPRLAKSTKNLPLIVMPHGGPWARDTADYNGYQWEQAMAELGYVVLQPNYRGSTGYGKAWVDAANKNWGYRMQDDLIDGITYLAKQGIVDPSRVCIMGWSYGGYAASRAAQRDGKHYRCAISGAGPSDIPAMVRYDKNYLGTRRAKQALGSASSDLVDVSPALHPAQYSIPILIVHGAKDQRVPVSQSRDLVSRLKGAGKVEGKDFVYIEQPLNTHNLLREEDRVQFLQEVKKFLDQNNPA